MKIQHAAWGICLHTLRFVFSFALLGSLPSPQNHIPPAPGTQLDVAIYRDEYGVPHIEADDEESAWYALGYEEARDALYWVQLNLRRFRGQATQFLGGYAANAPKSMFGHGANFDNDAIVGLLGIDLFKAFGGDEGKLKTFLRRTPDDKGMIIGNPDQVFLNLRAYAAGLNDYRKRLRLYNINQVNAQEKAHRDWIESIAPWALTTSITVWDVAAYGPWIMRMGGVGAAMQTDLARFCEDGYTGPPVRPSPPDDPFHEELPGEPLPGGSQGFCWNYEYSQGLQYSGVMGDGQGKAAAAYVDKNQEDFKKVGHHRWFAHIIVPGDPAGLGEDPGIDVFGHMVHGSGMFIQYHNQDVAFGGSQALPNRGDGFLLRVKLSAVGVAESYYSYYTNSWEPFTPTTDVQIARYDTGGNLVMETLDAYRAGRFGFVIPDGGGPKVFWAEETTDWEIGPMSLEVKDPSINNFWCAKPDPNEFDSMPVVVALRVPGDPNVHASPPFPGSGGFPGLGRFAVGLYEGMRATDVYRMQHLSSNQEAGRGVNFCAIDRDGRVFATVAGNIPRRGDDDQISQITRADGTKVSSLDKLDLYDKAPDNEPVPARWNSDKMFDWVFDGDEPGDAGTGEVKYLKPVGQGAGGNPDYASYILHDPTDPSKNHPAAVADVGDNTYENLGFIGASNEYPHFYYKKTLSLVPKDQMVPQPVGNGFNHHWSPDNAVVNEILEAGTHYRNRQWNVTGARSESRYITDFLLDIKRGLADPLDVDTAQDFAWDNRRYVERDYQGYFPAGGGPPILLPELEPTPLVVRSLRELDIVMSDVLLEAHREVRFFRDLWQTLWSGQWNNFLVHGIDPEEAVSVDLKSFWVDNGHKPNPSGRPQIFWYPDGQNAEFFEMPEDFALIDFLWSEIRLGAKKVEMDNVDRDVGFDNLEQDDFSALAQQLVEWEAQQGDDPEYRNASDSESAALLLEYQYGFNANTNGFENGAVVSNARFVEGRMWSPVSNGRVFVHANRFPDNGQWTDVDVLALNGSGGLPCSVDSDNKFTTCGQSQFLQQFYRPYSSLYGLFSHQLGSLLTDDEAQQGVHKIARHPVPPYHALYSDPATFTVKPVGQLTQQDINDLVLFFLVDLGGFKLKADDDDDPDILGSTTKVAAVDSWLTNPLNPRSLPWDEAYPLTRNLVRVLMMRRLLEADDYLNTVVAPPAGGDRSLGTLLRTGIRDFEDNIRFPEDDVQSGMLEGVPTEGGVLRAVAKLLDGPESQGFQSRVWAIGGSNKPLFTLLPAPVQGIEIPAPPRSFFGIFPGQRNGTFGSPHFAGLADEYADRKLVESHYSDYVLLQNHSSDEFLPVSPYKVPQ